MRVKENNLRLYRCDICWQTYSEYDGKEYGCMSLYYEGFEERYDCCPICTKAIMDLTKTLYREEIKK